MTLSDFEWLFHASRAISAVAELLVFYGIKQVAQLWYRETARLDQRFQVGVNLRLDYR